MMKPRPTDRITLSIRLGRPLYQRIKDQANDERRSLNNMIEIALEQHLDRKIGLPLTKPQAD